MACIREALARVASVYGSLLHGLDERRNEMNWHKPIIERGDFVLTPYELTSVVVMLFVVGFGVFGLLVFGD